MVGVVEPGIDFVARRIERVLTEIANLRDDMSVLTAMVMGLDGSHTALLQETRATHAQIARMTIAFASSKRSGKHLEAI